MSVSSDITVSMGSSHLAELLTYIVIGNDAQWRPPTQFTITESLSLRLIV